LGCFPEDYGLEQIAIEDEGKSPSAQALQLLLARLKKESIRWVFIQPQHSQRMAMTVATSIGAEIEVLDPLAENYIDNMKNVAQRLALAMRAQAAAQRGH
jgi:zinc transport system substrate-binding protein